MHNGAAAMIEDGVVLVLAAKSEAGLAALARTMVVNRAEVPAPRPLQQIAAECRHVADLRARRGARGVSQGCVTFLNDRMVRNIRERDQRAYAQRAVLLLDD